MTPPPHDLDAEAVVLSHLLIHPDAPAPSSLRPAHFYAVANRLVYAALLETRDAVLVARHMRSNGFQSNPDDGLTAGAYVARLCDTIPATVTPELHADDVRRLARLRKLRARLLELAAECIDPNTDPDEILTRVQGRRDAPERRPERPAPGRVRRDDAAGNEADPFAGGR